MANPERGEIEAKFKAGTLTLAAELGRVARWTSECGIRDIAALFRGLRSLRDEASGDLMVGPDPMTVFSGLKHLAIAPDNADEIVDRLKAIDIFDGANYLLEALTAGQEEDTEGNQPAPKGGAKD